MINNDWSGPWKLHKRRGHASDVVEGCTKLWRTVENPGETAAYGLNGGQVWKCLVRSSWLANDSYLLFAEFECAKASDQAQALSCKTSWMWHHWHTKTQYYFTMSSSVVTIVCSLMIMLRGMWCCKSWSEVLQRDEPRQQLLDVELKQVTELVLHLLLVV